MWLDAALAYLHFISIFLLFSFLAVEVVLIRRPLDLDLVRLIGRMDLWYFGAAAAVLASGVLRLALGAKGPEFYLSGWPIYAKLAIFLAVGLMSVAPTLAFIRWRREMEHDPAWRIPPDEQRRVRRRVMVEIHLLALVPLVAVIMSRGLAR
jgi:putative membrane protein